MSRQILIATHFGGPWTKEIQIEKNCFADNHTNITQGQIWIHSNLIRIDHVRFLCFHAKILL